MDSKLLFNFKLAALCFWSFFALVGVPQQVQAEVTVGATLQPASTNVGEPVQLSITVNGSQRVDQIPTVAIDGAQAQHIGQNTQIQLINSNLTVSLTNRYLISPTRIGDLEIPAIDVLIDGNF